MKNFFDYDFVETMFLFDRDKAKMVHYDGASGYADGDPVYDEAWCPNCGRVFDADDEHYNFCPECGQRLKWEEEEYEENDRKA